MDYVALRKEVIDAGLLERQYGYYAFKIVYTMGILGGLLFLLTQLSSFYLQLLVIPALAFAFIQVGLLGHDAAHLAIFKSAKSNEIAGLLFFGFLTGIGYNHWVWRHNAHHANPNMEEEDPDTASFAQTKEELLKKKGIRKFIYRRQHYLFPIVLASSVTAYQFYGIRYNKRMKPSFVKFADSIMMALHFAVFWVLPFFLFGWWKALTLIVLLRLLMGFYFGAISATNHKGMPVMKKGQDLEFVEKQVITTRNVRPGILVDFFYGGLNYQIEHHLFPTMPRVNFSKVKPRVIRFCQERGIPFEQTGVIGSYRQILKSLRDVVHSIKNDKNAPASAPVKVVTKSGENA